MDVLNRFKSIADKYSTLLLNTLSTFLSPVVMKTLLQQLQSTVDTCGVNEVANQLMTLLLTKPDLRTTVLDQFFGSDIERFSLQSRQLRKMLAFVFKSASRKSVEDFQVFMEEYIQFHIVKAIGFDSLCNGGRAISEDTATRIIDRMLDSFFRAKAVCQLEMWGTNLCNFAAERAWRAYFMSLSSEAIAYISIAVAVAMNAYLDTNSSYSLEPSSSLRILHDISSLIEVPWFIQYFVLQILIVCIT
jgi:hypothetical protein